MTKHPASKNTQLSDLEIQNSSGLGCNALAMVNFVYTVAAVALVLSESLRFSPSFYYSFSSQQHFIRKRNRNWLVAIIFLLTTLQEHLGYFLGFLSCIIYDQFKNATK